MLLAFLGFAIMYKRKERVLWGILVFTAVNIYIVFSWPMWYYGGSFGCRALVQSYAILALPLGYAIQFLFAHSRLKVLAILFIICAAALNLFQTMQYSRNMIHTEGLSAYTYSLLFGKTSVTINDIKRYEKIDIIKSPFVSADTLMIAKPDILLASNEAILYNGNINPSKGRYIYVSARGKFSEVERNYKKQPTMQLIFRDKDSHVLSERNIALEPLMCTGHQLMNNDYMGDAGVWTYFDLAVKKPVGSSVVKVSVFNSGTNQTLIGNVVIENVAAQ
jgi:hypothetical protein